MGCQKTDYVIFYASCMNMLEDYSQRLVQNLERRKSQVPYSFIWCLLGLSFAFGLFGILDNVWVYYLEGLLAFGAAVVLFVIEACWRRITELKTFLSEYVEANRNRGAEPLWSTPKTPDGADS
jgi:hypothetical protein